MKFLFPDILWKIRKLMSDHIIAQLIFFNNYLAAFPKAFYNDESSQGIRGFWKEGTSILLVRMRLKLPAFASGSQLSLQNQTLRVGTYACR